MRQFNAVISAALESTPLTPEADAAWFSQNTLFHYDQFNRQLRRYWND